MRLPRHAHLCLLLFLLMVISAPSDAQDAPDLWTEIFTYRDPATLFEAQQPDDVVLLATGDVLLARTINAAMLKYQNFTYPFKNTSQFLSQADLTWVNLETPILTNCPTKYEGLIFCGTPQTLESLTFAGVDVVNLANNHAENYGEAGVIETEQHLTENGLQFTGRFRPVIREIKGKRIGLLGFTDVGDSIWVSRAEDDAVVTAVKALRGQVDYLVVGFHWGIEYHLEQSERQRDLARMTIDAGADVVIGHHPHWVQGVELYHSKPIIYSLGNFVFDQSFGGWVDEGAAAVITFGADRPHITLVPVVIRHQSTPDFPNEWRANQILKRIKSVSAIVED